MSEKYYITNGCKFVGAIAANSPESKNIPTIVENSLSHAKRFKQSVANKFLQESIFPQGDWTVQKIYSRSNGNNYVITNATKFVGNKGMITKAWTAAKPFKSPKDAEDYIKNHRELARLIKYPIIINESFEIIEPSASRQFTDEELVKFGKIPKSFTDERKQISRSIKTAIYNKAGGRCQICGAPLTFEEATIDHILPISRGGKNEEDNYAVVCSACNTRKSNNTQEELNRWTDSMITNRVVSGDFAAAYPAIRALVRTTLLRCNNIIGIDSDLERIVDNNGLQQKTVL